MKSIFDKLFPKEEQNRPSSKLVDRGLEAIRLIRDEESVTMGTVRRTPSHFELRVSPAQYQHLEGIDAMRDVEFYLKDELMKEMAAEGGRTFGDHTIHVRVAADESLNDNEIYAVILNPDRTPGKKGDGPPVAAAPHVPSGPDATRVLGDVSPVDEPSDDDRTVAVDAGGKPRLVHVVVVTFPDGSTHRETLTADKVVLGRKGSTGAPLPAGFAKVDLPLPSTVSREQLSIELDGPAYRVTRIGKGEVTLADGSTLEQGASRRIGFGGIIKMNGVELTIREEGA